MKRGIAIAVVATAIACYGILMSRGISHELTTAPRNPAAEKTFEDPSRPGAGTSALSLSNLVFVWKASTEAQYYSLSNWREVAIVDTTLGAGGSWTDKIYNHSTAFDVTATGWRRKDELFFAGLASNGDTVVEKWKLKVIAQPGGNTTKIPVRTELYRGTGVGRPVVISGDPEGRFVLLIAGTGSSTKLYSLTIQANTIPVVLFSAAPSFPLDKIEFVDRYQHNSLGRIWVYTRTPEVSANGTQLDNTAIILIDSQNDGIFESTTVDNEDDLYASGVLGLNTVQTNYDRE